LRFFTTETPRTQRRKNTGEAYETRNGVSGSAFPNGVWERGNCRFFSGLRGDFMNLSARRIITVALAAFALGAIPAPGQEALKNEGRKVVVNANSTVYVKPDGARLVFVVTSTEPAGKNAREAHDKQVKDLQDALAAVPLKKGTIDVHVLPSSVSNLVSAKVNAAGTRDTSRRVQSTFYVTVREKDPQKLRDAVARLAEAAADNGGTAPDADSGLRALRLPRRIAGLDEEPESVPGPTIEWFATPSKEAHQEAIRRAVREAKAEAQAVVGDGEIVRVVATEISGYDESLTVRLRSLRGDSGITEAGHIPLRINVRVTFAY
jgi:uncharacterized protein YggE